MTIQNLINEIKKWIYRDDVAKFDQEYEELTSGEQFPDEKEFSRQLDFAKKTFNGQKISTDFSTSHYDNTEITGLDNTTD
jgi:hypothetical protein